MTQILHRMLECLPGSRYPGQVALQEKNMRRFCLLDPMESVVPWPLLL